ATSQPTGSFSESRTLTAMAEMNTVHFAGHINTAFTFPPQTTNVGGAQAAMVGRLDGLSTAVHEGMMEPGFALWPNPVAEMLYIELDEVVKQPAELLNSAGQMVRSVVLVPGRNAIGISALPAGLYLLRTRDGRSVRVVKE
ncbi:MAG TPA: T9SS type A sorting domain-containing protein, partial [Flavobacteriales bacterium]|nr:T9SS type A sorting domain-containing protein [Flavobacteriales bacterium]